jgi:hypothetical protein
MKNVAFGYVSDQVIELKTGMGSSSPVEACWVTSMWWRCAWLPSRDEAAQHGTLHLYDKMSDVTIVEPTYR